MRTFNKLYGIPLLSLLLSVAACTSETEEPGGKPDSGGIQDGTPRREVLLTLKNKLSVPLTKAGDAIATAAENKISSLDIYVFGSKTEDGAYTYQERFCYREKSGEIPVGDDVTALDLNAKDADGKETTALISLKKGLFVKLYCIANQRELIDPATNLAYADFSPLVQSNPGQANNMVTAGVPEEDDFKLLQSVQLDPASTTDILLTPLPMTGSYATPLDLTDFSVSARLQLGFRLTRSVARFDVVNEASTSKFTIESVSMANGRKGVNFFPLTVTGKLPDADAGDLITYPARKFDGEKANEGVCTGAFYTWPSPAADGGYLILSGTYAANQTENIPVTYKIPFKPAANETGNYIEVSQNHRYTVEITKADEYKLDFTINVADWTDEGSIDNYEPGGDTDKEGMNVKIDGVNGTYDKDSRTVTMAITDDAQFAIEGASASGYYVTMYYEGGDTDHQWLTMTPTADNGLTKADVAPTTYTIKKTKDYSSTNYPIATIRFTEKITAKETIVIVEPIANPVVKAVNNTEGSSFKDNEILLYKTATVADPSVTVSVFASGGSELENVPAWLNVSPNKSQIASNAQYTFTVNVSDLSFPDLFPTDGVTITAKNMGDETKTQDIIIKMKSNMIVNSSVEGQAEYDDSSGALRLYSGTSTDKVKLTVNVLGGSEIVNVPGFVTVTKENDNKNETTYTFVGTSTGTGQFTIRSKFDNAIVKTYNVYSIDKNVTYSNFSATSGYTTNSGLTTSATSATTITYFPCTGSTAQFTVVSPKGVTVSNPNGWSVTSTNETTLASGQKQTIVKIARGGSYTDASFATFQSNLSATVTDKYNSSIKKTITIKQYSSGIVYPGSNIPAKRVDGARSFWIAQVDRYGGESAKLVWSSMKTLVNNGTACPSGWRVPSKADLCNLMNNQSPGVCVEVSWGARTDIKAAFGIGLYWISDQSGWGLYIQNSYYGYWDFGADNRGVTYRCIKDI